MPAAGTAHDSRAASRPARMLLFDVKGMHAVQAYRLASRRMVQAGAVEEREHEVGVEYGRHARAIDERFFGQWSTTVQDHMARYGTVRGLVAGFYGEASSQVVWLARAAADAVATRQWRWMGARSADEVRSWAVARCLRRLGAAFASAHARHLSRRIGLVGVTRDDLRRSRDARARAVTHAEQRMRTWHYGGAAAIAADFWLSQADGGSA